LDAIKVSQEQNNPLTLAWAYVSVAGLFRLITEPDSSLKYARLALNNFKITNTVRRLPEAYTALSSAYKMRKDADSALIYLELANSVKDSLNNAERIKNFQNIGFSEVLRSQEMEREKVENQNRIRTYGLLLGIVVFMIIAFLLYRNNRHRKKANELLQKQKIEIEQQKMNVEHTLAELKSTQKQLIQSEKMASLGELTAGIAHEIQNPLNFVNNFSEVNKELLLEMKDEIDRGNFHEAKLLADDLIDNQEKINQHGKRADAIVKGMLQHSRASTGKKEPTDINALCDEYLRLSYHGLRAKDKSFNATMKTDFDESIGKINIIPQDIGRVVLNLYNNAFYAVSEKKKEQGDNYDPTVSVSTKRIGNKTDSYRVEISVKDNGMGIPQKVLDKIFQPFFTTKPTGQGTGLGLSLSYDIIKAHGGELKVETMEGEGSEFIISLPI
jgi:signal transduction histidine kinase